MVTETTHETLPLLRDYPRLKERLPRVALGVFPTPVEKLPSLDGAVGIDRLYIKRDDLSGVVYGGNKVRKLEFLLGAARRDGARGVMTVGFAGSNHALATAIYARQLGLTSTSLLLPQLNAQYVRRNLLAGLSCGAELAGCRNSITLCGGILSGMLRGWLRQGVFPKFIPAGGSCPLGVVSYVNAAMELREQIAAGELPAPDRIYVPLGSMGTSVGLALGLQAAGLKTQVIAVRVIEERLCSPRKMKALFDQTSEFLHQHDPSFPIVAFSEAMLTIENSCLGEGYARFTEAGARATELLREKAGIILNGAYSAKAVAALLSDAQRGELGGKVVLFWNTYNSRDLTSFTDGLDYRELPRSFHRYFEEDVQLLDTREMRC